MNAFDIVTAHARPRAQPPVVPPTDAPEGVFARRRRRTSLADVLRIIGAGVLLVSLSQFLLAGIDVRNDLQRFALLLLQSAIFTGGGLAVGRLLHDGRGARLFFGLALVSVPAGFAVLGAMIYAFVPLDGGASAYSGIASWRVGTPGELLPAAAGALAVLSPTSWFGFSVMARRSTPWLVPAFLGLSALLLIPVRDPAIVSAFVALGLGIATWLVCRHRGTDLALATLEGRFAQALLFVPPLLIAGRALALSRPDTTFTLVIAGAILVICRTLLVVTGRTSRAHVLLLPCTSLAAMVAAGHALLAWDFGSGTEMPLLFGVAAGAVLLDAGCHTARRRMLVICESLVAIPTFVAASLMVILSTSEIGPDLDAPYDLMVIGTTFLLVSAWAACRTSRTIAALALLPQLWLFDERIGAIADWATANGWQTLGLVGVGVVVAGSLVQRRASTSGSSAIGSDHERDLNSLENVPEKAA